MAPEGNPGRGREMQEKAVELDRGRQGREGHRAVSAGRVCSLQVTFMRWWEYGQFLLSPPLCLATILSFLSMYHRCSGNKKRKQHHDWSCRRAGTGSR